MTEKSHQNACYDCPHRRDVLGSAHSSCVHPLAHRAAPHFIAKIFGGSAATNASDPLQIEAVPHGVKSGWFAWPINFDPVWLIHCAAAPTNTETTDEF